jgi:spore germination cell wall hydrolase CwlJ-like protein
MDVGDAGKPAERRFRAPGNRDLPYVADEEMSPRPRRQRQLRGRTTAVVLATAGVGLLVYGSMAHNWGGGRPTVTERLPAASASAAVMSLPPPDLLKPLSPQEAVKANAERPLVKRPDTAARKFVLKAGADDRERALTCLAQAVYYEAAAEGAEGERAVAQVVLNRMHHPGYPASVCGVVYQGSERGSGCQFTFTCDGSLLRTPVPALWTRARKIAEEALAGRVFASIGHATHYHADYVLPYWADSLDKSVQIGRHIFYRLRGLFGDNRSFFQRYAGAEPHIPTPGSVLVLPPSAETAQLASGLISDGSKSAIPEIEKAGPPALPLLADASPATLLADGQAPRVPKSKAKSASDCAANGEGKRIVPLGANDMRAGLSTSRC